MPEAVFLPPGTGEILPAGAVSIALKATGETTAGTFFLSESTIPPGFQGPPLHRHRKLHDMFYVLEGTLTFHLGDERREARPGTFVCVPPGVAHTFSNQSEEPVRVLNMSTPAGGEHYMRELAEAFAAGTPPLPEEVGRIASRYDFEVVSD
jgi:mannose-6-phosphate isomerase-like protein (cupin superfamily)